MMARRGSHKARMQRILDHVQECYGDIDEIAQKLVLKEMRELSKRWHNRTIHFVSAMGTQCVYVPIKGPRGVLQHQITGTYSYIDGVEPLEWMQDLDDIGEQIGNGCASLPFHFECKFRNGRKVK